MIPRPCALAVLVVGKKARGILGANPPRHGLTAESVTPCIAWGEKKGRFAHPLKVANRSFVVAEGSPGASVSAAPMRASFLYW